MKITKQQLKQIIKEELANVLAEQTETTRVHKGTLGDKLTAIVNAWGGYRMAIAKGDGSHKEKGSKLIEVLKSFNVPKELAMKIIRAKEQEEVQALASGEYSPAPAAEPAPEAPAEKGEGEDLCGKAKAYLANWKNSTSSARGQKIERGKELVAKHCGKQ